MLVDKENLAIIIYALVFILGCFFPVSAFAYQIFQRAKHLQDLRDDFRWLGIGSEDINSIDLREKYNRTYAPLNFLAHSILPFLITIIAAALLFLEHQGFDLASEKNIIPALRYGFIGAYIFSIQLVYRRYTTLDLQPTVYMYCTLTLITGLAFNYTAFLAIEKLGIGDESNGIGAGVFAIVAFSLGYFPSLAIRWFNQIANSALGNKRQRANSLPLSVIDGISQFHETRLRDEGIDNVQNLAAVKIEELLMNTRFNLQQVLEWVDQAILKLYVDPGSIDSFRRGSVRKISDFRYLWEPFYEKFVKIDGQGARVVKELPDRMAEARQNRALQLQSTPEYLDALYAATSAGPNMAYIDNYWKNQKKYIQEMASTAVEEGRKETKSVVKKTQIDIFEKISEHDLYDGTRETLGEIAKTLAPDLELVASGKEDIPEQPSALAGLAWWYLWLTESKENDLDFTDQARTYYEKAVHESPDNPKIRYELAKFYTDRMSDYEKALEHAEKAVELFKSKKENEPTILALAFLALICMKSGKQDIGKKSIIQAVNIIKDTDTDVDHMEGLENLQEILKQLEEVFDNKPPPAEVIELRKKFEDLRKIHPTVAANANEGGQ